MIRTVILVFVATAMSVISTTGARAGQVPETRYRVCGDRLVFIETAFGTEVSFAGVFNDPVAGQLPADACDPKSRFIPLWKENLSDLKTAVAACISIRGNGGDAEAAVLRRTADGRFEAELKTFYVDLPDKSPGTRVKCY